MYIVESRSKGSPKKEVSGLRSSCHPTTARDRTATESTYSHGDQKAGHSGRGRRYPVSQNEFKERRGREEKERRKRKPVTLVVVAMIAILIID